MADLILVRHGQSAWNLENRFTGWWDVDLTEKGVGEARAAGRLLKERGFAVDIAFTSLQTRAIRTCNLLLSEMQGLWVPLTKDWRFNERHYGALTGLDKAETAARHGDEQVRIWRRSFDVPPPPMVPGGDYDVAGDRRYRDIAVPAAESLKDTIARVLPAYAALVEPELRAGRTVLMAAHGNSLRALEKHLSGISDSDILNLEIPTGRPIHYVLDAGLGLVSRRFVDEG